MGAWLLSRCFILIQISVCYILKLLRTLILVNGYDFLPECWDESCMNRDLSVSQVIQLKSGKMMFTSHSLILYWKVLASICSQESPASPLSETVLKQQIAEKFDIEIFKRFYAFQLAIN